MPESNTSWSRGEAKALLQEAKVLLRRARRKLSDEVRAPITSSRERLAAALKQKDADLSAPSEELQKLVDTHLGAFRRSKAREYAESIIVAVLVALTLRATVIELFQIPTASMDPTLLVGDRLFVQKFAYGLRVPFTNHYVAHWNEVERGDIIVFTYPADEVTTQATIGAMMDRVAFFERTNSRLPESLEELAAARGVRINPEDRVDAWGEELRYTLLDGGYLLSSAGMDGTFDTGDDLTNVNTALPHGMAPCVDRVSIESSKNYIKRVVGVAGDRVRVEDNVLYINDEPAEQTNTRRGGPNDAFTLADETLPGGVVHTIAHQNRNPNFDEIVVREGHVFVMGDNRDNSSDGRCWGQVPVDHIKGSAMFLLFSIDPRGGRRADRFLRSIDP